MILDPWNNEDFILNIGRNIIKGAVTKKNEDLTRHNLEFNYRYDMIQNCGVLHTINKTNNYNNIELKIFDDLVIIENISRSDIYRGSEYLLLALQIIYKLNIKQSKLTDMAYFTCDRKMNYFSNSNLEVERKTEIYNKLIYLLRFGSTFYMPFGYKPVINKNNLNNFNYKNDIITNNTDSSDNNYINLSNIIEELLQKLFCITWNNINEYIDNINNILKNNKLKNSNKIFNFRIYNYKKWKIYWNNIYISWNKYYSKYNTIVDTPFRAFSLFTKKECDIFINWLELYSFSVQQIQTYNVSIFNNNINNNLKILAGINDFKKLKYILYKCEWLNDNIKNQPLLSIYDEKI